jgi:hypothetical protein
MRLLLRIGVVLLAALLFSTQASAHVAVTELENLDKAGAAWLYLLLGYKHILPLGFDHILFVLSLFLLSPKLKMVVIQSTVFTIAHSVTLMLAAYHVITPLSRLIEPLIALSIVYVALENIISPRLKPSRIAVVFLFGLVHGLGFAGALAETGLPQQAYLVSLISFNIGVELGQLTVILVAWALVSRWFSGRPQYRSRFVVPVSLLIALVAGYWTVERLIA